jgi:hypothetical protein
MRSSSDEVYHLSPLGKATGSYRAFLDPVRGGRLHYQIRYLSLMRLDGCFVFTGRNSRIFLNLRPRR